MHGARRIAAMECSSLSCRTVIGMHLFLQAVFWYWRRYHIFVSRQRERCAPHPSSLNFRQGNVVSSGPMLRGYVRLCQVGVCRIDGQNERPYHRWAEEFAANHGWLLFHDKVKTSQVYLHDTTLVGSALCPCVHLTMALR